MLGLCPHVPAALSAPEVLRGVQSLLLQPSPPISVQGLEAALGQGLRFTPTVLQRCLIAQRSYTDGYARQKNPRRMVLHINATVRLEALVSSLEVPRVPAACAPVAQSCVALSSREVSRRLLIPLPTQPPGRMQSEAFKAAFSQKSKLVCV